MTHDPRSLPQRLGHLATGRAGFVVLSLVVGLAAGAAGFTFVYGKGASYLGHDAAACANCHIMERQYAAWLRGSHRSAATCNDCHTPGPMLGKYLTKAQNGFWHSFAFTTGRFPEPIRIKPFNRAVTEQRCRDCHATIVAAMVGDEPDPVSCLRCHAGVGHRD